jgi:archaellum component FlaC
LSNETQTPVTQPLSAQEGNGFDNVAAQYRAMQEAQLLHEETINQLREEVRGQREKLAELSKPPAPAARGGQVDVVMMRLGELERKIGEGAPDPLINEIVHRLASLENAGPMRGMKDSRVDEVCKQLEGLRQKVEAAGGGDSRTDDVVLRIASLEAAFRRAAQSRDPEEVQARIDSLAEELSSRQETALAELRTGFAEAAQMAAQAAAQAKEGEALTQALRETTARLGAVEARLGEVDSREQLAAFGRRLDELGHKLAESADEGIETRVSALEEGSAQSTSDDGMEARVSALEERATQPPSNAGLEEVANRVDALQQQLEDSSSSSSGPSVEQLRELEAKLEQLERSPDVANLQLRVEALAARVADADVPQRLTALGERLQAVETRLEEAPEAAPAGKDLTERLHRLELELRTLQAASNQAGASAAIPGDLSKRLDELETRIAEAESSSRLEDTHDRLKRVENTWASLGDPAEIGRRLTVLEMDSQPGADPRVEELIQRLIVLESKPFDSVSDSRLQELGETVAALRAELETLPKGPAPLPAELPERLARLEAQVREISTQPASGAGDREALASLQSQIQALGGRMEELASQGGPSAPDSRISELLARIEWIERQASEQPASSAALLDEIKQRLQAVEQGLSDRAASGEPMTSGAMAEIAARFAALEEGLNNAQSQGGGGAAANVDVEALVRKETERWNQWARSTIDEIGEIRGRVDGLGQTSLGLDAESVEALGVQISSGLNNSEVKALRGQMYFVYLSIGVLWAIVLYLLFAG